MTFLTKPVFVWMGCIITERLIGLCAVRLVTKMGDYVYAMPCSKIAGIFQNYGIPSAALPGFYPECIPFVSSASPNQYAIVRAGNYGRPEQSAAALDALFGMTLWIALMIHAIGVEVYVSYISMHPLKA
jgi:hypothetical protein